MASRYVDVTLAGQAWKMPASYAASKEIAETVGDPLQMAIKAQQGDLSWTIDDIVSIIYVGVHRAGASLKREQIAEQIVDGGVQTYLEAAINYVISIVSGEPERPVEGSEKK